MPYRARVRIYDGIHARSYAKVCRHKASGVQHRPHQPCLQHLQVLCFETGRMCYGITVPKAGKNRLLRGFPTPKQSKTDVEVVHAPVILKKLNLNRKNYILGPINRGSLLLGGNLETFIYITVSTMHDDDNNPMQRNRSL